MVLTVSVVLLGLLIGRLRGGRIRNLATWPVHAWPLFAIGIAGLIAIEFLGSDDVWVLVVSTLSLIGFGFANLQLRGMPIVMIGLALGLLPVLLNGAVPVRAEALVIADLADLDDVAYVDLSGAQRLERTDDQLAFLGDILPLPLTRQVLSFGELIVLAGLATIAANATRQRRTPHAEESDDELDATEDEPAPTTNGRRPEDVIVDLQAILDLTGAQAPGDDPNETDERELTAV